jgi:hypothetical protein
MNEIFIVAAVLLPYILIFGGLALIRLFQKIKNSKYKKEHIIFLMDMLL